MFWSLLYIFMIKTLHEIALECTSIIKNNENVTNV